MIDADELDPSHDLFSEEPDCWKCGGEGSLSGEELNEMEPFWYDDDKLYDCPCCGGSGQAKDCRYW
jgi:hypothetical protein